MSIQDQAARLRAIADSDELPTGLIRQAESQLESMAAQLLDVLGDQSSQMSSIAGSINAAQEALASALAAAEAVKLVIHGAADYHGRG